jgi:hypothetical protein
MEVAVTVTLRLAETWDGELYVAEVDMELVKVPQAASVSPVTEQLQVTPLLLESFSTVAVNLTACPASTSVWPRGNRVMEMAGEDPGGL